MDASDAEIEDEIVPPSKVICNRLFMAELINYSAKYYCNMFLKWRVLVLKQRETGVPLIEKWHISQNPSSFLFN